MKNENKINIEELLYIVNKIDSVAINSSIDDDSNYHRYLETVLDRRSKKIFNLYFEKWRSDKFSDILLGTNIERAYEIFTEKGYLTKEQLQDLRFKLMLDYPVVSDVSALSEGLLGDSPQWNHEEPLELARQANSYRKIMEFYLEDSGDMKSLSGIETYEGKPILALSNYDWIESFIESLKHIEATAGKIELNLIGTNRYPPKLDKIILKTLVGTWGNNKEKKKALKQIDLL